MARIDEPPVAIRWLKQPAPVEARDREAVINTARDIINAVRDRGDAGVREYSEKLDRWNPERFRVSREDVERAYNELSRDDVAEIEYARDRVRRFAKAQLQTLRPLEITEAGMTLGHRLVPVRSIGAYVPGGGYPLIASVYMQLVTARVAGVQRIAACAPSFQGRGIAPATLVAMDLCGADEIYALGGVQALAAMAFGTEEIAPVDMLTGPGNAYVAEAKRQLFGVVGIDLLAGPTEILIIADDSADPEVVACDLLGQAEHGPTSPAVLVTDSAALADAVHESLQTQLPDLPTREVAGQAWQNLGGIAVVDGAEAMVAYADWFAPEHLEVITADPQWYAERLRNYGSLFLGEETTVAYSDKAEGTNHILPTGHAARYTGGLWVGKFIKVVTYQRMTREASLEVAPHAGRISEMEGMLAHKATCDLRIRRYAGAG
jgi:sulfopropanediol 3-dehydrogenase